MSLPKGSFKSSEIMKTPFIMFQSHPDDYYNMSQDAVRGIEQESLLSRVFFHPVNVDLVQKKIITEVFRRTNGEYLIEKQDEADLQIIMRSIFLQYARHAPNNIKDQIRDLNNLVADEVFPGILTQIKSYFGYLDRAFGPTQIMDRPENVSSAGTKMLPSVTRTFDASNAHNTK